MVHCTKCGTNSEEGAKYCGKCGASLEVSQEKNLETRVEEWGEEFGKRAEKWGEQFGKRAEEECFGLPHGGSIAGLIIGIIIILVGLSWVTGFVWDFFWPAVIIIIGMLIIAGAIYGLTRR